VETLLLDIGESAMSMRDILRGLITHGERHPDCKSLHEYVEKKFGSDVAGKFLMDSHVMRQVIRQETLEKMGSQGVLRGVQARLTKERKVPDDLAERLFEEPFIVQSPLASPDSTHAVIHKRIKLVIDAFGITIHDFIASITSDARRKKLQSFMYRKTDLSDENLRMLFDGIEEKLCISKEWMITGNGPMYSFMSDIDAIIETLAEVYREICIHFPTEAMHFSRTPDTGIVSSHFRLLGLVLDRHENTLEQKKIPIIAKSVIYLPVYIQLLQKHAKFVTVQLTPAEWYHLIQLSRGTPIVGHSIAHDLGSSIEGRLSNYAHRILFKGIEKATVPERRPPDGKFTRPLSSRKA